MGKTISVKFVKNFKQGLASQHFTIILRQKLLQHRPGNNTPGFCFRKPTLTMMCKQIEEESRWSDDREMGQKERGEAPIFITQVRHNRSLNESLEENRDERITGGYFGDRINKFHLVQREGGVRNNFIFSGLDILENVIDVYQNVKLRYSVSNRFL